MKHVALALCMWVTLAGALAQPERTSSELLDLTGRPPLPAKLSGWGSVSDVGGEGGTIQKREPLRVRLAAGPSTNRLGADFVYDVTLENITEAPVRIPWEPDWRKVETGFEHDPPPGYLCARVTLWAASELGEQLVAEASLYGSNAAPGSLMTLRPGESVRIRAPGTWQLGAAPMDRLADLEVLVTAGFDFSYGPRNPLHERSMKSESHLLQLVK